LFAVLSPHQEEAVDNNQLATVAMDGAMAMGRQRQWTA
jgi:hypothetical protein